MLLGAGGVSAAPPEIQLRVSGPLLLSGSKQPRESDLFRGLAGRQSVLWQRFGRAHTAPGGMHA